MKNILKWGSRILFVLGMIFVCCFFLESWRKPFFLNSAYKILKIFLSVLIPSILVTINYLVEKSFNFLKIGVPIVTACFFVHYIIDVNTLHLIDCFGDFCIIYHLAYCLIAYTSILFTAQIIENNVKNSVENVKKSYLSYYKSFIICFSFVWAFDFSLMFFVYRKTGVLTHTVNIVPLKGELGLIIKENIHMNTGDLFRSAGNVFFFTLMAIIIKYYLKNTKTQIIILIPIILSSLIEISQFLLKNGDADIDDVILNTLGFLIGLVVYKIIFKNTFEENKKCLE